MKAIRRFTVRTVLPERLGMLEELATNLRRSWHQPTRQLFRSIDPELWELTSHDPVAMLGAVDSERLEQLASDDTFVGAATELRDELHTYLSEPRWYQSLTDAPASIAYFSPEFGIAAALPQYSGGLGILAGDHLKAASDLGVPIIGVGLFYRAGYFRQAISREGWQLESYPVLDPDGLPLSVLRNPDGSAAQVVLALPDGGALYARIWQVAVGRITLLLLDTDIPENSEQLRTVTDRLYGGGGEHRLLQELLLGIGGVRAIKVYTDLTGVASPGVFHTNEGHAGFLGLERISDLIGQGLSFAEALQVVRAGTVFTTHTPVPAGIDRFEVPLIERYMSTDLLPGVDAADVLALGTENYEGGDPSKFNMAVMGLRLAQRANGVSQLHGEVSREMFGVLWPEFDPEDVPITSVTNGVHAPTWTDPLLTSFAAEKFGNPDTTSVDWMSEVVSDADLWAIRGRMRDQLVRDARRRVSLAWQEQNPGVGDPAWFSELLDPEILTIGFARRVPTYKRLTLMLQDQDRLRALLTHPERPIQLVIAGKSHPADDEGKRLIRRLVEFASEPEVRKRIVFLPNYDIGMAKTLYPGTDVWLNNPLRPLEACGTSGMKAALNGSLNLSILDGWWAEFYDEENGWAIPSADSAGDGAERDKLEAESLYDLIEHQIAPRFYDRNADDVPTRWVESIRHTLATLSPELSADRMVKEYVERLYIPAARAEREIEAKGYQPARELAAWKARVTDAWPGVHVAHVESGGVDSVPQLGDELHLRATVDLAGLTPDDVLVEVVYGRAQASDRLVSVSRRELRVTEESGSPAVFAGTVPLERSGSFGYTVRVVPKHPLLASDAELGLVAVAV
ncbi:starch phosphorylase [Microbacteriaceae bacterium SG_E_30_P1]|uniref:glycogen phosphorylase n=1 Tax=Antiquaquibacter oligotrophicus TaxID=2880260 RepID=A0ABT6KMZ5_9MICO|nr:alpha-glucan family phosphorylase [Antiquaquibacter oligotrophicus]MDH6181385.1 starch phosphorylase [Antiquaquibacter oligotrophicus]UDF12922.1 alpha-glucan family phosphorylase [Antiquaquibacter oligotrophicus]